MGSITIPNNSRIYLDADCFIYSVERHPDYWPLIKPVWTSAADSLISIFSSQLIITETLVVPLRSGNFSIITSYEAFLSAGDLQLLPITEAVLREAASIRAKYNVKTPDAIHAATALLSKCDIFLTNDKEFGRFTELNVLIAGDSM